MTALHLPPGSNQSQRELWIGPSRGDPGASDTHDLVLDLDPHNVTSFSSLRKVLQQLSTFVDSEQRGRLERCRRYLDDASPLESSGEGYVTFLADAVTLAIMRRISRESTYTSRIIESSATLINDVAIRRGFRTVIAKGVDRIDRPSLKVLARSLLLLRSSQPLQWRLESDSLPEHGEERDSAQQIRGRLLTSIIVVCQPQILVRFPSSISVRPDSPPNLDLHALSVALVTQNYDAVFEWTSDLRLGIDTGNQDDSDHDNERLRLRALAAVNVGCIAIALGLLRLGEQRSRQPDRKAHLCYLQGLIQSKRGYDLDASDRHYARGLAHLDNASRVTYPQVALEQAWLRNGLALNAAMRCRATALMDYHTEAFRLVREAFGLVEHISSPAHAYARFNLLANAAFLMEMRGLYSVAIETLSRIFEDLADQTSISQGEVSTALDYRIGLLYAKMGHYEESLNRMQRSLEGDEAYESWPRRERVLRALGCIALKADLLPQAECWFSQGLELGLKGRSREGATEHARGLAVALHGLGLQSRLQRLTGDLEAEGVGVLADDGPIPPSPPAPKLPPYYPEIDLEDVPAVDINRYLSNSLRNEEMPPWREPPPPPS